MIDPNDSTESERIELSTAAVALSALNKMKEPRVCLRLMHRLEQQITTWEIAHDAPRTIENSLPRISVRLNLAQIGYLRGVCVKLKEERRDDFELEFLIDPIRSALLSATINGPSQ